MVELTPPTFRQKLPFANETMLRAILFSLIAGRVLSLVNFFYSPRATISLWNNPSIILSFVPSRKLFVITSQLDPPVNNTSSEN